MTIENKEAVMRRIEKLLAIAQDDRADPNEAAAAAGMAEKIMRKYQLEHADVIMASLKKGDDMSTADVVASAKTNGTKVQLVPAWANWIGVAVSKFTEVSCVLARHRISGEACIQFRGFSADIRLATWTFEYLVATTIRLVNAHKKTDSYAQGGRATLNNYRHGVALGIVTALNRLRAEKLAETRANTTGNALMIVKSQAIAAEFGVFRTKQITGKLRYGTEAFVKGMQDGKAVDVGRRAVGGTTDQTLRLK